MDAGMLRPSTDGSSRRIVAVVDDDATTLEVFRAILEYDGYDVRLFPGALGAHEGIASARPNLVILDMLLRGEYGSQVLEKLKSDPLTAPIPVVVCTAATLDSTALRTLERHACQLLPKPFDLDALLEMVRELAR